MRPVVAFRCRGRVIRKSVHSDHAVLQQKGDRHRREEQLRSHPTGERLAHRWVGRKRKDWNGEDEGKELEGRGETG